MQACWKITQSTKNNNSIDILRLTETQIRPTDKVSLLNIAILLSLQRKTDSGSGVVLFYTYQYNMIVTTAEISKYKFSKYLARNISLKIKHFFGLSYYRLSQNSKHLHENLAKLFAGALSLKMRRCEELILLGDMKVNYLLKEIKSVISSHCIE